MLISPRPSYRIDANGNFAPGPVGENLPRGALVHFYLNYDFSEELAEGKKHPELKLTFKDSDGTVLREFSSTAKERSAKISAKKGFNRFAWDLRTAHIACFDV